MENSRRISREHIVSLSESFARTDINGRIDIIASLSKKTVFTTSLGMEDQVLTWAIAQSGHPIRLVTLQTGRLFAQTLSLLRATKDRYNIAIEEFHPDPAQLENFISEFGKDGFYESIEARKACCIVRKIVPLAMALSGAEIWITGLRRTQSQERRQVEFVEWDESRHLMKINPLADWSAYDIREAVSAHDIPVNPLHLKGYPSIGCEPCTRAINPGEPERAGRWWWEQSDSRECGLHVEAPQPTEPERFVPKATAGKGAGRAAGQME